MKKIKLITTLSSLGAIAVATPIVATSCSNNKELGIIIDKYNSDFEYKRDMTGWISINGYSYDGKVYDFSDKFWFKEGTLKGTCNQQGITINNDYADSAGFILVKTSATIADGTYTVTISGDDEDGHKGSIDVTITVAEHAYTAFLLTADGWDTYDMLYYWTHFDTVDQLIVAFIDGNEIVDESKYNVKFDILDKSWGGSQQPDWFKTDNENKTLTITDTAEGLIPNNAYVWFSYTVTIVDTKATVTNYAMFYANFNN